MKITELNTNGSSTDNPCELVSKYLFHEKEGGTFAEFISSFDFGNVAEMEKAIRQFVSTICNDRYMRNKKVEEKDQDAADIFTRFHRIRTDASKIDKFPRATANDIWNGGYARGVLNRRTAEMYAGVEPSDKIFRETCEKIKRIYGIGDVDIEKIRFFVEQVKAGEYFPSSLRRMLYIWSDKKKTGKTTVATMLVCLLNGDTDFNNIYKYSTNLSNEMQIKSFAVPKISECNACLMDECFYADMGKTYADFKRFITSNNGRARLPYGQEFIWYGQPNYVATSNDSLKKFIKDWGDRRYLSVNFESKPTEQMPFEEICNLWKTFILNSSRKKDWQAWADELMEVAEEKGDRTIIAEELELELRKLYMINQILNLETPSSSAFCAQNRVSLKTFVDWFAMSMGNAEAHKRRSEIEVAVTNVYGKKYSTTNYWLVSSLKETAERLKNEINYPELGEREETTNALGDASALPF